VKVGMGSWRHPDDPRHIPGLGFNSHADRNCREDVKTPAGRGFNIAHNTTSGKGRNPDGRKDAGGTWFHEYGPNQGSRNFSSKSTARKMASAMIAKIPEPLARYIARTYRPTDVS
jgi:hypothetical protein